MSKKKKEDDMIGKHFGFWTVLEKVPKPDYLKTIGSYYRCQCICGTEKIIYRGTLKNGHSKSCGCYISEKKQEAARKNGSYSFKDETNNKYGKLTVLKRSDKKYGRPYWICQCECGNIVEVAGTNLRSGHTKSCGCILMSRGERVIEQLLKENNIKYERQYSFDDLRTGKNHLLRFDFGIFKNNKLEYLIECDGGYHLKENAWRTDNGFDKQKERDIIKNNYCLEHNIILKRIPYNDRDLNITIDDIVSNKWNISGGDVNGDNRTS